VPAAPYNSFMQGPSSAVAEFVRALALAWKNLAAYPTGHPALTSSIEAAHQRLAELRGPAADVVFGVASDGLIHSNEKVDWSHAQKLANALYTRGVALVRFGEQTTPLEIEALLRALGSMPGESQPIWESLAQAGVAHIHFRPVDFSSVRVTDDLKIEPQKAESSSIWEDILEALLEGKEISADAKQMLSSVRSVDEIAALVTRHVNDTGADTTFDPESTFGVRILSRVPVDSPDAATGRVADAIGTHVMKSTGLRRQHAVQQVVQLLRSLPDPLREAIIRSVMEALASDESGSSQFHDFVSEIKQEEVLDALRYLSSTVKLSSHAARLLGTLAASASEGRAQNEAAPAAVFAELVQLFGEEDIDRFNPPDHQSLLDEVSVTIPDVRAAPPEAIAQLQERVDTVADDIVNLHVARTLIELIGKFGTSHPPEKLLGRIEEVVKAQVESGQFSEALEIVRGLLEIGSANEKLRAAVSETLKRLAGAEIVEAMVAGLLAAPPEKATTIHWLIDALGSAAMQGLLIALAEENNRSRRRKLFDFLVAVGPKIVPDVTAFLADSRWYVVRNMILILRSVNDTTSLAEIRRLAEHQDLRVRLEAIKTLLTLDQTVPRTLLEKAILDPDPKLAEMAIALVGSYGIREGVEPLLKVLEGRDVFGTRRALRLRAIKALGELAAPEALPAMERFFHEPILPWPHRAERRAAWESLTGYPSEVRAAFVERGLRSRDTAVRELCRRLTGAT
jgi:hypothetical protein